MSTKSLCFPGMCLLSRVKWNEHSVRARHLMRCIALWSLLCRVRMMWTTAMLSQRALTVFPTKLRPQMAVAITTGRSSFILMCNGAVWLSHCIWNHSLAWKAPQPQLPDASEMIMLSGASALRGARMDIPFQVETIWYHHSRSARNCWLMRL